MKRVLSAHDRECIKKLIELGLFTKIMPEKLAIGKGIIIAPCSDGDQFDDVYSHIAGVCKETVDTNRIHPIANNGGAILMSGQLPEKQCRHGQSMMEGILDASEIKKIEDVFLYSHFPCAIAHASGLGVIDQGNYLMMAKQRLKQTAPQLRVKCFFHIDMYDETEGDSHKRRTYFLPKELWKNPDFMLPALHNFRSMCESGQ